MTVGKNRQQAEVDAAVKVAKARRRLSEVAERASIAPESLTLAEIRLISAFVLANNDRLDANAIGGLAAERGT